VEQSGGRVEVIRNIWTDLLTKITQTMEAENGMDEMLFLYNIVIYKLCIARANLKKISLPQ